MCQKDNDMVGQKQNLRSLGKIAFKESLQPVRPGQTGKRPFWNLHSKRFIYAPAFDFQKFESATHYRFTAISEIDSQQYSFEAEEPWAPITPIWGKLPCGVIQLKVEALNAKNGQVIDIIGEKEFLKSHHFNGYHQPPAYPYRESGFRSLKDLLYQPKIQYWLENGEPDPDYPLWVHPTKIMGAVARGMIHYAKIFPEEKDSDQALKMAEMAANFLLSMVEPKGSPLEFWPPTFWDGVPRGNHPVYHNEIMTNYPAEGAMVFLDMFTFTSGEKYYLAAQRIADTYVRTQNPEGTWPQLMNTATGEAAGAHKLIPTAVIDLFDRLSDEHGLDHYKNAREKAFRWCMDNPVRSFDWQAQFEDTRPQKLYKNLSRHEATKVATLLFRQSREDESFLETAKEILRFAEDQFVVWEPDDPVTAYSWFRKGSRWDGTTREGGCDWFIPCALEQYKFYTPISASNISMVIAFLEAFKTTGEPIYHAKAVALANSLTIAQQFHGGGEIPTHLRKNLPELNWINCGVYPALMLIRYADILSKEIS